MVILRYLALEDIDQVIEWQRGHLADDLFQWAGSSYEFPLDYQQIWKRLMDVTVNTPTGNTHLYVIEDKVSNKLVGTVELVVNDHKNKTGSIGKFLIDKKMRGKGLGQAALMCLIHVAFDQLALDKLFLKVFDCNPSAIRCYEKAGFITVRQEENVYKSSKGIWNRNYMMLESEIK